MSLPQIQEDLSKFIRMNVDEAKTMILLSGWQCQIITHKQMEYWPKTYTRITLMTDKDNIVYAAYCG